MTIDERLERLTGRHEALTQSVEMLLIEGREQDKRMDTMDKRLSGPIERLVGVVEKLTDIVKNHEGRLNGLEGTA
jgi:hypothetical protein